MDRDVLRPNGRVLQFQRVGLSEEIHRVVVDSPRSWVGLFM